MSELTKIKDRELDEARPFEFWLQRCPYEMRMALITVADTAFMCKRWLEDSQTTYSASDIMSMTRLVLAQEREQKPDKREEYPWRKRELED